MSLPAAEELFRPTVVPDDAGDGPAADDGARDRAGDGAGQDTGSGGSQGRTPSGRVRHDEKMTVYVTADELLDLEHARLVLRRNNRLAVDRGRLVREAVAIALADLEANGDDSAIVHRLMRT